MHAVPSVNLSSNLYTLFKFTAAGIRTYRVNIMTSIQVRLLTLTQVMNSKYRHSLLDHTCNWSLLLTASMRFSSKWTSRLEPQMALFCTLDDTMSTRSVTSCHWQWKTASLSSGMPNARHVNQINVSPTGASMSKVKVNFEIYIADPKATTCT